MYSSRKDEASPGKRALLRSSSKNLSFRSAFSEDKVEEIESGSEQKKVELRDSPLVKLLELALEWLSLLDFASDALVLYQLWQTANTAWLTVTVISLLAPFFICYTPLLAFLRERFIKQKKFSCCFNLIAVISVSPLMLAYLALMDTVFIFNSAVLTPLVLLIKLMTCGCCQLTAITAAIDASYEVLFEM